MYMNFWYPVCLVDELGDAPKKVRVLGLDFALFRDSAGVPHCVANTCAHRGGSLATSGEEICSKVVGDNIRCPYHGWEYDGAGRCQKIPSMGKQAKIPARAKVDSYPVIERYGIVFAFLGDLNEDERPGILEAIEHEADGWFKNLMTWDVAFNYERSIENALDPAHNEFVHPTHGFSGQRDDYMVPDYELEETPWGVGFMTQYQSSGSPDSKVQNSKYEVQTEAGSGNHGPNQVWTYIHISEEAWFHQYMYEQPIDEGHTRIYLVNMRNFLPGDDMSERVAVRNKVIAQQDVDVLSEVNPVTTPLNSTDEIMVPADRCIVRYREFMADWKGRGWRLDMDALAVADGKKVFAIPSPARRTEKSWVIDPVPML